MTNTTTVGRWYPNQPPKLDGETDEQYTDRLTGADGTNRSPYDHRRNRQCSIGWHGECSDRDHSGRCECPHHDEMRNAETLVREWNRRHPVGTAVTLPAAPEEPPTTTTGPAVVEEGWPVVTLAGFDHPVKLSWVAAAAATGD